MVKKLEAVRERGEFGSCRAMNAIAVILVYHICFVFL